MNEQDIQQIKDVLSPFGVANYVTEDDYEFVQVELPEKSISIWQNYLGDRHQTLYATKDSAGNFDVCLYGVDTDTYMIDTNFILSDKEFTSDNLRFIVDLYCRGLRDAFETVALKESHKKG